MLKIRYIILGKNIFDCITIRDNSLLRTMVSIQLSGVKINILSQKILVVNHSCYYATAYRPIFIYGS